MNVLHEGPQFRGEWKKLHALRIEKETELAFLFTLSDAPIRRKWLPKSVVRVEQEEDGLTVKVPLWVR